MTRILLDYDYYRRIFKLLVCFHHHFFPVVIAGMLLADRGHRAKRYLPFQANIIVVQDYNLRLETRIILGKI